MTPTPKDLFGKRDAKPLTYKVQDYTRTPRHQAAKALIEALKFEGRFSD